MILEKIKTLDIENIGDTEDGIEAGIADDSMPFVFEFVSTQLYSNPIGSLIREITSNAHDAHVEAGNEDPVIIRMYSTPDEGWFIEFIDKGVGISPERMLNIYMNYFSSTKRSDNKQIGGFGLGSKTPLAYQEYFYIDTVFNGFKYSYLYHKGETKPTLESLKGFYEDEDGARIPVGEVTEERNGTTIRILIKGTLVNGTLYNYGNDISKFRNELSKQLTYFDDVYFQGCSINNEYDIYEGKYFKFRSDIEQGSTYLHISLGNVRYSLDTNIVKIPNEMIQVPVAVKFEVGELKVTPSRESLRYTESDIKKIKERVDLLKEEITEKFNLQNPIVEDLEHFLRTRSQLIKIVFNADKGHTLRLWHGSSFSKSAKYAPLSHLNIKYPENMFFMWKVVGMMSGGAIRNTKARNILDFQESDFMNSRYMIVEDINHLSQYTNAYIHEALPYYSTIYLIMKDSKITKFSFHSKERVFDQLGLNSSGKFMSGRSPDNRARIGYEYIKEIDKQVVAKSLGTYESYKPTKEWLAEYKRRIYEQTAAYQRAMNEEIFVRDISLSYGTGRNVKKIDLLKSKEFVIFGYREDRSILERLNRAVRYYYDTNRAKQRRHRRTDKTSKFMVIQVAQSTLKGMQYENPNIIYCQDFFKHKFMINLKARFIRTTAIDAMYDGTKSIYLNKYEEEYQQLKGKYYGTLSFRKLNEFMWKEDIELIPDVPGLLDDVEKFKEKYDQIIPIVSSCRSMDSNSPDWLHVLRIIKESRIRIKNQYYLKTPQRLKYERRRNSHRLVRHIGQYSITQNNKTEDYGQEIHEEGCQAAIQYLPEESREELHRED